MLIEGTLINCNMGGFWAVFGVSWAVLKVEFVRECGISAGNTACKAYKFS